MKLSALTPYILVLFNLGCGSGGADEEKIRLQVKLEEQALTIADLQAQLAACPPGRPEVAAPAPGAATVATPAQPSSSGAATPAADPGDANLPGEIEVKSTTAVQVLIDGKTVMYNPIKMGYVKRDLSPGPHLIELQISGVRQTNWSDTVNVLGGKRLRFQHKLGQPGLTQLGTVDARGSD